MALTAGDVVSVGLGAKWMPAVPILQVLCVHALIRSADVLVPPVLMARYRTTFLFWYVIGLLVVMPVAFWGGAVAQDGLGVALVWVVVYPLLMVWAARAALDELRISWVTVWTETRPVIETVAAMAGCLLLVQTIMPGATNSERAIRLGMSLVVGGAVYGLGVFWRGGAVATEVSEVFRWLVRREGAAGTSK
jgi:teichuronic acid exporter